MSNSLNGLKWKLLSLMVIMTLIKCQGVTWTDLPQLRMSQTSIYDTVYIPVNTNSQVDLTYKTAFASSVASCHTALVISGFENYLQFEMIMNITILSWDQTKMTINIWIGPMTNIKQMKVNYFVMQKTVGTLSPFIFVSVGNYRTLDLDDANGPRNQTFTNETSLPLTNIVSVFSAIHGMEYYNTDGTVNEINVNTQIISSTNTIQQVVSLGEKGRLNYISITTILIDAGFYPNPNTYLNLGYAFQSTITNTTGLQILSAINAGGLFSSTDNSLIFGMRGFNFTMQGTRLFLLQIATVPNFQNNLVTNTFMKYTEISVLVLVQRTCTTPTDFYFVQGFQCMPSPCTGKYENSGNQLCQNCASVCNGCTTSIGDCVTCTSGTNRVVDTSIPRSITCICDYNSGYVEVNGNDICQLCSVYLPGCVKCSSPLSCDNCGDPNLYQSYAYNGTNLKCRCKNNKYLVTGKCLSYPGCLTANQYVTGEFCETCDTGNNFEKDLTNNSSCKCMMAYFPDPTNSSQCIDICGDGHTPDSPANATQTEIICDDNNTVSGDGCSQSCRQQFGYKCTVKTKGSISICAQNQEITINYLYSEKNLIANQGTIVFALLPPQNFLPANTFESNVNINITGNKKIVFDPTNSLIIITIDYSENLQGNTYQFDFSFLGLSIFSKDINLPVQLNGRNAKLQIGIANPQVNIITYVALAVSAFALVLALVAAFLGEKMMGIQLILPVQAAFFSMATFPKSILSPISALWSLKFSNGYNSLDNFDLTTNYMLDSRVTLLQYSGQYLLNYNIMFSLLALVILILSMIGLRIWWLERQQNRLQELLKKIEQQEKQTKQDDSKKKKIKKQKVKQQDNQKTSQVQQKSSDKQTQEETAKDQQVNEELVQEELEDVRQNMMNWKNFMYMIFDRFFAILIVTAMMQIIFCFYLQLSNLTYTNEVFNNSLNAGFFFITYATIVTGLYAIVYDYKTDKLITFTCNKGKYAMFYIALYLAFIIVLGALYQTDIALYAIAVFPILVLILIPYQIPYGLIRIDFQTIIAMICQFPFVTTVAVSFILNFQKNNMTEQNSVIFAYVIIGMIGLSIMLTIARMIKVIDCKKVSCIQFTDRKKDSKNDKNKKKNKIMVLDELDLPKNNWDEYSQDSVRSILKQRIQEEQNQQFNIEKQNKDAYDAIAKKNEPKSLQKDKQKVQEEEDDQQIDELEKIKLKLRKDLKQKKMVGKIK